MATLIPVPVDDPRARAMLEEYFHSREIGFAHQGITYSPAFPAREVFTPPAGVFLVAVDEDGDVGCGGIRRVADGEAGIRYEVKHLFLREAARGKGWGRTLLDALETYAREWGAAELVLDTHHSLEAAAGLYRSSGFVEIPAFNDNPNATRWYRKVLRTLD